MVKFLDHLKTHLGQDFLTITFSYPLNKVFIWGDRFFKMRNKRNFLLLFLVSTSLFAIISVLFVFQPKDNRTLTDEPEPSPKEPLPTFEYGVELELDSANGFIFSKKENINRDIEPFMVLLPGKSGTIPFKIFSTGNQNYNLTLNLNISGLDDEFECAKYSLSPISLWLQAGETAHGVLTIESTEDTSTGYYNVRIKANNGDGSKGASLPDMIIAPIIPKFVFFYDPTSMINPSGEVPVFEVETGEKISVMIHYAKPLEPLTFNFNSSSMIEFQVFNDVIEIVPIHPRSEPRRFYQIELRPKPETPQGTYFIKITGNTESDSFERSLILNVESK